MKEELKRYLDSLEGVTWFMVPGSASGTLGAPDMILCVDGRFVGVEVKTPTGKLTGFQITRKIQIEMSGGVDLVVRSTDQLCEQIEELRSKWAREEEQ